MTTWLVVQFHLQAEQAGRQSCGGFGCYDHIREDYARLGLQGLGRGTPPQLPVPYLLPPPYPRLEHVPKDSQGLTSELTLSAIRDI